MLTYISADQVYPVVSAPVKNGVLALEDDGTIAALFHPEEALAQGIESTHYKGLLVPGLVNTHCHLELSHLWGKIPEHTGLPGFVQQVIQSRQRGDDAVLKAMQLADQQMYVNGIVAVGDISNQLVSKPVKLQSPVYYHTFIEAMGFNPSRATAIMQSALQLKSDFAPLKASVVPHAPYSVSPELFKEIYNHAAGFENPGSMHNQETVAENAFFQDKSGAFLELYQFLGLDISFYQPSGKSSLQTVLPMLPPQKMLLVHNTVTAADDIAFAKAQHDHLYWCLCPNANLYIENRLPDVGLLKDAGLKITLGTDSLASNHQLSILEEMKTLQAHQGVAFADLLLWATLNGAEFLGITEQFGTLAPGKKPGINLIEFAEGERLSQQTIIKRLF